MKNAITVLFVSAVLLSLTGCGIAKAINQPCNLSSLHVKSVILENDKDGMVATAIKRELYARGAQASKTGVAIVGDVRLDGVGLPLGARVHAEGSHFAGLGTSMSISPEFAASQIAHDVARDFCRCMAGEDSAANRSLKKE